jgi:hypothetical protein
MVGTAIEVRTAPRPTDIHVFERDTGALRDFMESGSR